MGVRDAQKQATRERVLAAARELFVNIGYEAATVRMIAQMAGVATGSVFTTFPNKGAILQAVMEERVAGLSATLEALIPALQGSALDQLRAVMAAKCEFEMRRPQLFAAFLSVSYNWSFARNSATIRPVMTTTLLSDIVRRGIEAGEIRADADVATFIDLLMASYGSNFRRVARDGLSAEELCAVVDAQITMLFEGVRPKAAA